MGQHDAPDVRPAVSVVVPVFEVAAYLPACLDSLLTQTFRDFEVVVVDDGSTDGSAAVIERYASEAPERFVVVTKANGGLGDARNAGMARARGRYLTFVDGDDTVVPTMLAALIERAESSGADLVVCGIDNVSEDGSTSLFVPEPEPELFGRSLEEEPRLLYRLDASACGKLFARSLVERSKMRFPVGVAFEDLPTVYRVLAYAKRVEKVDAGLYRYRRGRPESITMGSGRYLDLVAAVASVNEFYAEHDLSAPLGAALLRLDLTHLIAGRYPDLFADATPDVLRAFLAEAFGLLDRDFQGWRRSRVCRALWPHALLRLLSTRRLLLTGLCRLPRRVYFATLARLGAFDARR